jgi:hypothetical protein
MMKRLVLIFLILCLPGFAGAATYNVTDSAGLISALNASADGDIINAANATYNLSGLTKTINYALTITGASQAGTIFQNGGIITLSAPGPLIVSNVTFNNWGDDRYFLLSVASGQTLDGMSFTNCTFDGGAKGIACNDTSIVGTISDFTVDGCTFKNFSSSSSVAGVRLYTGTLTDVVITDNTVTDFTSTTRYCEGIRIGGNATVETASNITITGNTITNITGTSGYEAHGLIAYGDNINMSYNSGSDMISPVKDHEMFYWKASNSEFSLS